MVVHGALHGEKDSERLEKRAKLKVSSRVYVYYLAFFVFRQLGLTNE